MSSDRRLVALASALCFTACTQCPPDPHVIRAMRVAGATFDPPVAPPGGAVTVRLHTLDVEDRAVVVDWYRCPANLRLTAFASLDGALDLASVVAPCLAQGAFAHGLSVQVPVNAEGGTLDTAPYRSARRFTDLVAFACADGTIEAPPEGGTVPRCTGTRGVLTTVSIPGPLADGSALAAEPATLSNFTLDGAPWGERDVPTVDRCEGARASCVAREIAFHTPEGSTAIELANENGAGVLGVPTDATVFVNYHTTAMAPAFEDFCAIDRDASLNTGGRPVTLAWVPSAETGEVTFWFTGRRYGGGLTVTRRTLRVQ